MLLIFLGACEMPGSQSDDDNQQNVALLALLASRGTVTCLPVNLTFSLSSGAVTAQAPCAAVTNIAGQQASVSYANVPGTGGPVHRIGVIQLLNVVQGTSILINGADIVRFSANSPYLIYKSTSANLSNSDVVPSSSFTRSQVAFTGGTVSFPQGQFSYTFNDSGTFYITFYDLTTGSGVPTTVTRVSN